MPLAEKRSTKELADSPASSRPARHAHGAVERVGAHADARAVLGRERRHGVGVARRQRADQDPLHTRGQGRLDLRRGAEAAADLHARAAPGRQAREHRGVLRAALAVACGIEVDHVQPSGARQGEAVGRLVGRLVEPRHAAVVALQEAHDAPAREIDGGYDFHCHVTMLTCRCDELDRTRTTRLAR